MNYRRKRFRTREARRKASDSAKRGWDTKRIQGNDKWAHREQEPCRVNAETFLGTLQWHGVDGSVRKLVVRQGKRANSIRLDKMRGDIGWDKLFRDLRGKLSTKKITL